MTARELVMTRGWNATDYHILNPGIEHWFTSVLPLAVHQCQIFPRRRHDARFLCQALKKLFVAGSVIAPHDGSHRRVGFQVVPSTLTILPFTRARSAHNPKTQKNTFRCVSTSISRRVRERVE